MKIIDLTISGFKNLGTSKLNFENNQITSLIALNNYGKSNFLESLEFAQDFIQANQKQKKHMMSFIPAVPINKHFDRSNFQFSITFETSFNKESYVVFYKFEYLWPRDKKNISTQIVKEFLKIKENKQNSKFTTVIKRTNKDTFYQSSQSGRCSTKLRTNNYTLAINKLIYFDDLFYHSIIEDIFKLNFTITNLMEVEPVFGAIRISDMPPKPEDDELEDGHNISKFLFNLKKNKNNLYELLINSFKDLIPTIEKIEPVEIDLKKINNEKDFKDIPFALPEKLYDLRIKEKNNNQTTSVKYVSRGTKRILLILATAIDASEKSHALLAFEELENSIHPSLLQKLLIILTEMVPNIKILITSHSPYLIQFLPISSIYLGIPNSKGLSCFHKIKESKHNSILKLASDEDASLGDYLFDLMLQDDIEITANDSIFENCACSIDEE